MILSAIDGRFGKNLKIPSLKFQSKSLPLHSPLHVLVDDVCVYLGGGDPGVAQNVREVEQVSD